MRKTETREIDGLTYHCKQMGAETGVQCFKKLLSAIGGEGVRLAMLSDAEKDMMAEKQGIDRAQVDSYLRTKMIGSLMEAIDKFEPSFIKLLLSGTTCDQVTVKGVEKPMAPPKDRPEFLVENFDEHFAGRYMHLVNVLRFAVETNFMRPT